MHLVFLVLNPSQHAYHQERHDDTFHHFDCSPVNCLAGKALQVVNSTGWKFAAENLRRSAVEIYNQSREFLMASRSEGCLKRISRDLTLIKTRNLRREALSSFLVPNKLHKEGKEF